MFWSCIYLKNGSIVPGESMIKCSFLSFFLSSSLPSIFIGVQLIYNSVLGSGVQQSESVIYLSIYITSFLDSFPIWAITECWVEFPVLYSRSLLVICFIHCSVFVSSPISQTNVCFFGTCACVKLLERAREKRVELWFFTTSTLKR